MLNIAKQIYFGWNNKTSGYPLPEAEIVPGGTTSNEKKRLANITSRYTDINEHENVPLPGFTLFKTNRQRYGSADQTWLIIDPRGFLARITNENLEEILYVTGITEGLIQEKCVWAREDSQTKLKLVPVSSDSYLEAVKNTELLDSKVNLKDVQIGDIVLLQNGLTGTFMGTQNLYGVLFDNKVRTVQTYPRRQVLKVEPSKYFYQGDLKILKVIDSTDEPMTKEEAAEALNADIESGSSVFTSYPDVNAGYYTSRYMVRLASAVTVKEPTLELVEIDAAAAKELFDAANMIADPGQIMLEDNRGKKFMIDFPYSISSTSKIASDDFCVTEVAFDPTKPVELVDVPDPRSQSSYYFNFSHKARFSLDNFVKFYKIVKHVKNKSYV